MILPVIDTYRYIPFPPPFYVLYLEVIYALTLKIASKAHVTDVFIVPEQRKATCSVLCDVSQCTGKASLTICFLIYFSLRLFIQSQLQMQVLQTLV